MDSENTGSEDNNDANGKGQQNKQYGRDRNRLISATEKLNRQIQIQNSKKELENMNEFLS